MSSTLVSPDSRPRTERRPRGTSFVGLVGVELRRLWWRRLTKAVLVAIVVVIGVAGFSIYKDTSPESLAERLDAYSQTVKQIEADQANVTPEQRAEQIAACKADQAKSQQDGGLSDFDCESIFAPPSPADFGLINTTRDAVVRSIVVEGFYVFGFLAFILGASFVAAEFASGSMGNWLTFQPRRLRVASAKLVAATIGGLAVAALVTGLSTALAAMITTVNRPGADLPLADAPSDGSLVQELLRISAAIALGGLGGAAIGLLLRSTAGVVGAVLGWAVVMEGLVAQGLANGRLQPWLVRANLDAFVQNGTTYFATTCGPDGCSSTRLPLSYTHGWVYLLVIAVVGVGAALVAFRRRDVS